MKSTIGFKAALTKTFGLSVGLDLALRGTKVELNWLDKYISGRETGLTTLCFQSPF